MKLFAALLLANSFSHCSGLYGRLRAVNAKPDVMPYTSDDSTKEVIAAKDYSPKSLSELQNGADDSPKKVMTSKDYFPKSLSKRQNGEKQDDSLNLSEKNGRRERNSPICSLLDKATKCVDDDTKPKLCSLTGNCEYRVLFRKEGPIKQCINKYSTVHNRLESYR